jgi:predicted dehydrogenase
MPDFSRRSFLVTAGAGVVASALRAGGQEPPAGGRVIRHAVVGLGGQGRRHSVTFAAMPDCDVVAVCDVDPAQRAKAVLESPDLANAEQIEDFRTLVTRDDIDSVSVATADHWHTPVALAALKAGKHVYVEKPCGHNLREGLLLEAAAKKTGLCVQHGTQSRSGQGIKDAVQLMRDGGIGKVRLAKAINHQFRPPIGHAPESEPPPGVNYDLWLGAAPLRPFTKNRWHYNWHWMWDYGSGDIGNDGIHQLDVARWGLGAGWPKAVTASGGQLFYEDDHETPDTQIVTYEYDDCHLVYEMRLWTNYLMDGHDNGVIFYGDKGTVDVGRHGSFVSLIGEERRQIGGSNDFQAHLRNFIDCVKAGTPENLNAPITEGNISNGLVHLGNIGTRLGRRLEYDAVEHKVTGDAEATKMLEREYRPGYELPEV